jgi:hypothetical protein
MGLIFAPVTTVAMRTIEPVLAGAASGFLNTARQIGGVMGSAIVGAVLQNQLVSALHDQARRRQADLPAQLPAPARAHLVSLVDSAGAGSLQVGRGQNGVAGQIPPGAPPGLAQEIAAWFHDVFVNAYITAMRPTMVVPIVFLFLGAASCLLIQRRRAAPAMQLAESATRSA